MSALEAASLAVQDLVLASVLLAAVFVPLERVLPGRPQGILRPGLAVDVAFMCFQYLIMVGVLTRFHHWMQATLGPVQPGHWRGVVQAAPWPLQVLVTIMSGDLLLYWAHRACHVVPALWRFHRVHHSATHLDWVAAHREHPLDGLYSQLWLNLPAWVLGVDVSVASSVLVLRALWAIFVHSNVHMDLGVVGIMLGDPVLHRWHHAKVERCQHNFANLAPYLDVLFGTHHRPPHEDYPLGVCEPTTASGGASGKPGAVRAFSLPLKMTHGAHRLLHVITASADGLRKR